MILALVALAGLGFGAFGGAQLDDAVETVTGERGGIPYLQLGILAAVAFFVWKATRK